MMLVNNTSLNRVIPLLIAATTTATGTTWAGADFNSFLQRGVQAKLSGTSGAISATVVIEVSNDIGTLSGGTPANAAWTTALTMSLSGTGAGVGVAADSAIGTVNAPWYAIRARVTAIAGTGTSVDVNMVV